MKLSMGIIKFEVSVPEAFRAIAAFRQDRRAALEQFSHQVQSAAADVINRLLQAEMTLFLGSPDQIGNKRNGYADRDYVLKGIGAIRIHMPIDRKRSFRSDVVPHHEQIDPRLKEDMAALHLAGMWR